MVDITRALGTAAKLTEMAVSCSIAEKDELLYYFALQHPGRTLVFCNRWAPQPRRDVRLTGSSGRPSLCDPPLEHEPQTA